MPNPVKYIFCLLAIVILPLKGFSQYFLYNEQPIDISVKFSRHSIEAVAQKPFFNTLKIVNNSNRTESFTLNFTVPQGWNIIGQDRQEVAIAPYDSLFFPVLVSIGGDVKGDIGYSVIASLTDSRGNTIKNEYCFIKIPRQSDLQIKLLNRLSYIDQRTSAADFSIKIENKGNREELINLLFESERSLGIGPPRQNQYAIDISAAPFSDTTFTVEVFHKDIENTYKNQYRLSFTASTIDTTLTYSVLFRKLDPSFVNVISETNKPLVVEFNAQGLIQSDITPNYTLRAEGLLLLKREKDLYYYYRNYSSRKIEDTYLYNRMYFGMHIKKWQFEIGDNYRSIESNLVGRGLRVLYTTPKLKFEAIGNENVRNKTLNIGSLFEYQISKPFGVSTGFAIKQNKSTGVNSDLYLVGTNFTVNKTHKVSLMGSYSNLQQLIDGKNNHNGFGGEILYSSSFSKIKNSFRVKYGSDLYSGIYRGRLSANYSSYYNINSKHKIGLTGYENWFSTINIQNNTLQTDKNTKARDINTEYINYIHSNVIIKGGFGYEETNWRGIDEEYYLSFIRSQGFKLNFSPRFNLGDHNFIITPQVTYSKVRVVDYPNNASDIINSIEKRKNFSYQFFSLNFRTKIWGFLASYTSGPKSIFDQYSYFFFGRPSRRLMVLPYVDAFIYKNRLQLQTNISYSNDLVSRATYTNFTNLLFLHLPDDWRISFLAAYSMQSRQDARDASKTFQTLYFEAGVKKEFNWSHPRISYNDVVLVFFKDFNGNNIQEPNEPGIKNVLVFLDRQFTPELGQIPGDVTTIELLSNNVGQVFLENVPAGLYSVNYNPVGKDAGTFSKAYGDLDININGDKTIFIPFVERNKVFGKIVLNRSKLSGLGRLDVSNVRITATDSRGNSHTTLTDKNGDFVLYAPVTDEYILTINNIFYENFDLRQNNFVVQFNGYKQFEVNFVFDEKVRRINFAATPEGEGITGIQQVRRTNISGSVKDANSQKPIRARVNLVNTRTNAIVTSTYSSATTGEYTMSFMAGDNYLLEIVADDYWYSSENLVLNQVTTFMSISRDVMLKPISVGSKVELNIQFEANSEFLAPQSVAELNRLLRLVKDNPTVKLEVQGHCDDIEALQKPEIALERAKAVSKYLIENGYSNLEVKSLGNTVPIASNDTEEGRSRNRRVEVEVISK